MAPGRKVVQQVGGVPEVIEVRIVEVRQGRQVRRPGQEEVGCE